MINDEFWINCLLKMIVYGINDGYNRNQEKIRDEKIITNYLKILFKYGECAGRSIELLSNFN